MRYLDRGPRVGDRIHVEYETVVTGEDLDSRDGGCVTKVPGYYLTAECPNCDVATPYTVRVIAPEPAVGDVVTEDMEELPVGSICVRDSFGEVAVRTATTWIVSREVSEFIDRFEWASLRHLRTWRIVRIGGTS